MIYFIAGKREAVDAYKAEHPLKSGEKIKYCTSPEDLASIYDWDKVILLPGGGKRSGQYNL